MEKYLHSYGAALYDEKRFDEAIRYLKRAVALDEQPYTRYQLCLAYLGTGAVDRALRELNRAIELNPSVAKYYHKRSQLRRSRGSPADAQKDYATAIALDPNYVRIEQIRSSYHAVQRVFSSEEHVRAWCSTARPRSEELERLVRELEKSCGEAVRRMSGASCMLPCPAYCCHFSGETLRHGLAIGAWKLAAIRKFLHERGLQERDYLCRIEFSRRRHLVRLIPPHFVIKEGDREFVYYPGRGGAGLTKDLLQYLPRATGYQELLWINDDSRACAFLRDARCMIHDVGGEASLPACKEFLCMTGFILVVATHLGMVEESQLRSDSMEGLNRLAVEALLILAGTVFNDRLVRLRSARIRVLKKAVESDARGEVNEAARLLGAYRRLSVRHDELFARERQIATRKLQREFGCERSRKSEHPDDGKVAPGPGGPPDVD